MRLFTEHLQTVVGENLKLKRRQSESVKRFTLKPERADRLQSVSRVFPGYFQDDGGLSPPAEGTEAEQQLTSRWQLLHLH